METKQIKSQYLSAKAQIVLIDEQCTLIDTCSTLFSIEISAEQTLADLFPVLESLAPLLNNLSKSEELLFPRIEFTVNGKSYISDFVFFRNLQVDHQIVWIIQDLTQQYLHFSNIQRERNELFIKNRRLEFQQEINAMQVELRYRHKIHQLQTEQMISLSPLSENESFDFTNTIWTLIHAIAQPEHKNIPLKLQVDKNIPPTLYGNQYCLCQILYNIITTILRNTNHKELVLHVDKLNHIGNRICLQFLLKDTDVELPNYSTYINNKKAHVSSQPMLHANNVPLYIAQSLLYDNGGTFDISQYQATTQTHTYSFKMLFDLAAISSHIVQKQE